MGDRKDEANPFYQDSVVHNFQGANGYNLYIPRLYLWDSKHQFITTVCKTFVDDLWSVAATQKLSRYDTHRIDIVMDYQTTRNRRPNSQTPGEWTGSMKVLLENTGLCVNVS